MKLPPRLAAAIFATLFFALHLPFFPRSLEDLDSINFALGVRDFDVAHHQPHPPGYPLFIVAAKAANLLLGSEVRALAFLSVLAGALAAFGLMAFFAELDRDEEAGWRPWLATAVVLTCPLFWLTSVRPLSDVAGLAAAVGAQALIVTSRRAGPMAAAAAVSALSAGIRSQVVWLTVPLLALAVAELRGAERRRAAVVVPLAYIVGGLAWLIPLIVVVGGPRAYGQAVFSQGAEDLSGVVMLATTPTLRQAVAALQSAFVAPWGYWQGAALVLIFAAAGAFRLLRREPRVLLTVFLAFGPYMVFDLVFQEIATVRYALPLVIPVAFLAVSGAFWLPRAVAVALVMVSVLSSAGVDDTAASGFAKMPAPAFRMFADMTSSTSAQSDGLAVLAMHRREESDLRRPLVWLGEQAPRVRERLSAPPKHEWLELARYWNSGGRAPVWFVADPLRSDLALVHHDRRPVRYRWGFEPLTLVGGVRPGEVDWHTIERPDWYLGEGWALTPETGGIAKEDRRGPGIEPISGWIRRWSQTTTLMIGGRNLTTTGAPARTRVAVEGHVIDEWTVAPGFFLRFFALPALAGSGEFVHFTVGSDSPDLAIEQFDAEPAGRVVFGFGDGWHEQEYNPSTGELWRWTSDRAVLRVQAGPRAIALTLRGEIEEASTSQVTVRAGDHLVERFTVGRLFQRTIIVAQEWLGEPESLLTIETSNSYVPAERRWRSRDRRRLGLKVYECLVTPAS